MTQQEKLLEMLRKQEWVSTLDCINAYMLRASDLVMKLRRKGYVIEERTKSGEAYGEYKLISEPSMQPKNWEKENGFKVELPYPFKEKKAETQQKLL